MKIKLGNFKLNFTERKSGLEDKVVPVEREGVIEFDFEYEIDVEELKQLGINTKEAIPMLLEFIKEINKRK